jgi:type II secretory pathway pseudopilin PulG
MRTRQNNLRRWRGFSLVEVLISFTVFGLMIGVIASAFVTISRTYRYGYQLMNAQKNLRFVLESVTREVKEGYGYYKDPNSLYFSFSDKDGNLVEYYVDETGQFIRKQGNELLPVISQDLKVSSGFIETRCTAPLSGCQPQVTFVFAIQPKGILRSEPRRRRGERAIQSRVSQVSFTTILQTTIVQRQVATN